MSRQERKMQVLKNLINDGGSATFARVEATVSQKQLKRGNPLANSEITKDVVLNVMLNAKYSDMVNRRLEKEGKDADFKAVANWHEKVFDGVNGSIVTNKNKPGETYYLLAVVQSAKTEGYFVNGQLATAEQEATIKEFKPKRTGSEHQGLDNEVIVRTIKVENINLVKCGDEVLFS